MESRLDRAAPRRCSVVICTRDRAPLLDVCLAGVMAGSYPSFDVIVVDNGSADGATRTVAERWGATYLAEPVVGLSRARNAAARVSSADILAYLDDDAVPEPDWLAALARQFDDPRVIFAAGRVLPSSLETAGEQLADRSGSLDAGGSRRVVDTETAGWFELVMGGGVGYGTNMAIRRSAFEVWPGFDERLGLGAPLRATEEHHAILELIERGDRVVYTPAAIVRHPYPRTLDDVRARYLRDVAAASAYFVMLLVERPRYRRESVRYALQSLTSRGRRWRPTRRSRRCVVPMWRLWLALASGPFLYGWASLGRRARRP